VWVVRPSVQLDDVGLLEGIAVEDPLQSTKTVVFEVIVIVVVSMWPVASLWAREQRPPNAISVEIIGVFILSSFTKELQRCKNGLGIGEPWQLDYKNNL
jgi:hypothetical protein